jgi:hypothetical protein
MAMRTRSAAATLLAILGLAGCSGGSRPTGNPPPSEASAKAGAGDAGWTVVLTDLRIGPSGVGLALHPTRTPILVAADSDLPLMACPADVAGRPADPQRSSFGLHWTRCRRLGSRPVALPGTDGR